jgi:hypothetical protein
VGRPDFANAGAHNPPPQKSRCIIRLVPAFRKVHLSIFCWLQQRLDRASEHRQAFATHLPTLAQAENLRHWQVVPLAACPAAHRVSQNKEMKNVFPSETRDS